MLMSVSSAEGYLGYKRRSQLYTLVNISWIDVDVHVQIANDSICSMLMDCRRRCRAYVNGMPIVFS